MLNVFSYNENNVFETGAVYRIYQNIIIIIIIIINCNWVITRWQCLLYMSANMKMVRTNMEMVNTKFKTGGLHEKHVVATWNLGNHLSICL